MITLFLHCAVLLLAAAATAETAPRKPVAPKATAATAVKTAGGMVSVPGGPFFMGCNEKVDSECFDREQPGREVEVAAFAIDRSEVTVGAYERYVQAANAERPWRGAAAPDPRLPVTGVRWSEASAFCASRGARLPTEFEWEAAARGPQGRRYAWGDTFDAAAASLDSTACAPCRVGTHPRGDTPEGVSDLIGNVWEWTSSRFEAFPGGKPIAGAGALYVIRGGAFNTPAVYATAYYRSGIDPSPPSRADIAQTGFRCAASLPTAGAPR